MKDLAQDVAEDVLGAAKNGNVKLFIVKLLILPTAICQVVKVFYNYLAHRHLPAAEPTPGLPLGDT